MKATPRVSVVIPAYNVEQYIGRCLHGLCQQSEGNIEIIVVDDGSVDGTAEIVRAYQRKDDRILYFHQENAGSSSARNRAIDQARGEFIAMQDADDYSHPERLARQAHFLRESPSHVVVGTAGRIVSSHDHFCGVISPPRDSASVRAQMRSRMAFVHPSVMIRRSALDDARYEPSLRTSEDFHLLRRLLEKGEGSSLAEPLYFYRMSGMQLTMTKVVDGAIRSTLIAKGRGEESVAEFTRSDALRCGLSTTEVDAAVLSRLEYALRLNRVCGNAGAISDVLSAGQAYREEVGDAAVMARLAALDVVYGRNVRSLSNRQTSYEVARLLVREARYRAHIAKSNVSFRKWNYRPTEG